MFDWLRRLFGSSSRRPVHDRIDGALPEVDAYEPGDLNGDEFAAPFSGAFTFRYVDGKGQPSTRTVDASTIMLLPSGDAALFGRCRDRQANRTFYASRMQDLADATTGEVLSAPAADLRARWQASPVGIATRAAERFAPHVVALLFIGRSTGRLSGKTSLAIATWIVAQPDGAGGDVAHARRLVSGRPEPTQAEWRRALKAVAADGNDAARVSLADLVDTLRPAKGKPDALRDTLIDQLKKVLQPRA